MKEQVVIAAGHFHALHRVSALAALEKGYFKDAGLDNVEITATGKDDLTIEAMKNGTIDFALDADATMLVRENGKGEKLYVIGTMINIHPHPIISAKEIKTVADLKGKRILGSREDLVLTKFLSDNGLNPDKDVTFVPRPGGAESNYDYSSLEKRGADLDRGAYQAVAISGWYSNDWGRKQIAKAGYNYLADYVDIYPGGFPHRLLATRGDMLEQNPQIVKGFVKGMIRAYRFAMDEKNEAEITSLVSNYRWAKELGWNGFDHALDCAFGRTARAFLNRDASVKGLDSLIAHEKAKGMVPAAFTIEQVTRLAFQQEALKEVNAEFGPTGYAKSG